MSRDKNPEERKPMCPICKTRHWSHEPHNFGKPKKKKR